MAAVTYVAKLPTCCPLLLLSPARRLWGPLRRKGLCKEADHFCAIVDVVHHFETLATSKLARVLYPTFPLAGQC